MTETRKSPQSAKTSTLDSCTQNQAYRNAVLAMATDLHLSGLRARYQEVAQTPAWQHMTTE